MAICLPLAYPSLAICCRLLRGRILAKMVLPATAITLLFCRMLHGRGCVAHVEAFGGLLRISSLTSSEKWSAPSLQTQTSCGSVAALLSLWKPELILWLCFHFSCKALVSRKPSGPVAQLPWMRISGLASTICSRHSGGGSLALTDVTQIASDMPARNHSP